MSDKESSWLDKENLTTQLIAGVIGLWVVIVILAKITGACGGFLQGMLISICIILLIISIIGVIGIIILIGSKIDEKIN